MTDGGTAYDIGVAGVLVGYWLYNAKRYNFPSYEPYLRLAGSVNLRVTSEQGWLLSFGTTLKEFV